MQSKWPAWVTFYIFSLACSPVLSQPSGGPPTDVFVEAHLSEHGVVLSPKSLELARGAYYRLNLVCRASEHGDPYFTFETEPLVRNSHLRVLTVDTIEVYVQGLSFRALQCEGEGAVKFSFYPIRAGTYDINVSNENVGNSFSVTVE